MVLQPFHLVMISPWPLLTSGFVGSILLRTVRWIWRSGRFLYVLIRLIGVILTVRRWWVDVVVERRVEGCHTSVVEVGIRWGIVLFIVREILLFFRVFWGFWHRRLSRVVELGYLWPPIGLVRVDAFEVPLLNTLILLGRGVRVTWAHHRILGGDWEGYRLGILITIGLGLYFLMVQGGEYWLASIGFNDRRMGRCFYIATGLHGCHVLVGGLYLIVMWVRGMKGHFSKRHHFGLEGSIWYWHFVDVVWVMLFAIVYWWGG